MTTRSPPSTSGKRPASEGTLKFTNLTKELQNLKPTSLASKNSTKYFYSTSSPGKRPALNFTSVLKELQNLKPTNLASNKYRKYSYSIQKLIFYLANKKLFEGIYELVSYLASKKLSLTYFNASENIQKLLNYLANKNLYSTYLNTDLSQNPRTKISLANTYPFPTYLTAMDTSGSKKFLRASLSAQYEARVAETTKKVDPHRAAANAILKDEKVEIEPLSGTFGGLKEPLPVEEENYESAPLLTLRELMPGATSGDDENKELDQSFRANRIEFMIVQRDLTPEEINADTVLKDAADVDWSIPNQEEYEDIMGNTLDVYTDERPELVHALCWSLVGTNTGVGCFSVKTGRLMDLQDIRGTLRTIIVGRKSFESFPKRAVMKTFSLTAFFPRSTKCVGTHKLIYRLLSCNRGLQGNIWPVEARKYPDDHPIPRRRGARILSFTGDQEFLDSLQRFPRDFPFNIDIANVHIRGGFPILHVAEMWKRGHNNLIQVALVLWLLDRGNNRREQVVESLSDFR